MGKKHERNRQLPDWPGDVAIAINRVERDSVARNCHQPLADQGTVRNECSQHSPRRLGRGRQHEQRAIVRMGGQIGENRLLENSPLRRIQIGECADAVFDLVEYGAQLRSVLFPFAEPRRELLRQVDRVGIVLPCQHVGACIRLSGRLQVLRLPNEVHNGACHGFVREAAAEAAIGIQAQQTFVGVRIRIGNHVGGRRRNEQ